MKVTLKQNANDPEHPMMHGDGPMALEFNKRQKKLFDDKKISFYDFEQVSTVILEILCDEYDKRNAKAKK